MTRTRHGLVHLLTLAMLLLPVQALYAQTEMQAPSPNHTCEHMQMEQADSSQAGTCCEQDTDRCNQNCRDCFQCQSINAIASVLNTEINNPESDYSLPLYGTPDGLPPTGQFRPPRNLI
ncbi:hypothetical protein [Thiohalophilus thiocyanatoxydans]|uniref:Uncharacterized protein n=1 Tax=Thiohalophilus thiocyanatoxydans TaxID=381308 RepID=A0A4R8IUX3_9GAMM|nr:hypothetical protein [Thiohalophilus thiocyanatoxydans]TDY04234.1 hypothetical protein EDC23_0607 [Thiohalophilus thiocyanatoxydans]